MVGYALMQGGGRIPLAFIYGHVLTALFRCMRYRFFIGSRTLRGFQQKI